MKKILLTTGIIAAGAFPTPALDVNDYCNVKIATPASVKDMHPLGNGNSFTAISDDGKAIEVFSYRTGQKISTIFSLDEVKGDVKIADFEGYTISDNEKKILIWNDSHKIYRHSFTAQYYVYDVLRKTLAPVSNAGPQRDAVLSHDGRMVAYMRDNNVYISNIDYKSDKAVTTDGELNKVIYGSPDWAYEEEFGMVNSFRWSGDDSVLAFLRFDESNVPVYNFDVYKAYSEENPLSDLYPQAYTYKYPLAGYPNSSVEVMAYNVDNMTLRKMDLPIGREDYVPCLDFDGKGANLMVTVLNRDQNHLSLYRVNPASTVAHPVIEEKSNAWLAPSAYQMVKYYANSFVIGSDRSGYCHLYEYDYNGNLLRQLTSGDWNVTDFYGRDAKTGKIFIQTTMLGAINRNLATVDTKGRASLLNNVPGTESASFSSDFSCMVRKYSSAQVPPQYTLCTASGKVIKELEMNRDYAARYASAPKMEFLKVPNAAGEEMDAYIIRPVGFSESGNYPLLIYQYNGPGSQLVLNAWKMDGTYYLASQGYVVAAVDGRGTGGRSRSWSDCVYRHLGDLEVKDQLAGASYFSALPYVNASRTACFGWSFGGYMTLMELSDPSCRFKAGVAMAPVADWRFYDSIYTERYMTTPQQNEAGYEASSALMKSGNLKGRLLIMSGTSDDNVHFYNTLKYASKLNEEGTIFDMMALAGFEHSLRDGNARARLYSKIVDFLDTHVKGSGK